MGLPVCDSWDGYLVRLFQLVSVMAVRIGLGGNTEPTRIKEIGNQFLTRCCYPHVLDVALVPRLARWTVKQTTTELHTIMMYMLHTHVEIGAYGTLA